MSAEKNPTAEIEITPEMIEAGINRLYDLPEGEFPAKYRAEEVFLAMFQKSLQSSALPNPSLPTSECHDERDTKK